MINHILHNNLARFIKYHNHTHAPSYDTIEAIISTDDIKEDLGKVLNLLNKDFIILEYRKDIDITVFLKAFADALTSGKIILVNTDTLEFNPIVYDQFIQFRESNKLTAVDTDISPDSNVFLVFNTSRDSNNSEIYSLADHVLDLRKEQYAI